MYIKITTNDRNSLLELHRRLAELGINYFVVSNQVMLPSQANLTDLAYQWILDLVPSRLELQPSEGTDAKPLALFTAKHIHKLTCLELSADLGAQLINQMVACFQPHQTVFLSASLSVDQLQFLPSLEENIKSLQLIVDPAMTNQQLKSVARSGRLCHIPDNLSLEQVVQLASANLIRLVPAHDLTVEKCQSLAASVGQCCEVITQESHSNDQLRALASHLKAGSAITIAHLPEDKATLVAASLTEAAICDVPVTLTKDALQTFIKRIAPHVIIIPPGESPHANHLFCDDKIICLVENLAPTTRLILGAIHATRLVVICQHVSPDQAIILDRSLTEEQLKTIATHLPRMQDINSVQYATTVEKRILFLEAYHQQHVGLPEQYVIRGDISVDDIKKLAARVTPHIVFLKVDRDLDCRLCATVATHLSQTQILSLDRNTQAQLLTLVKNLPDHAAVQVGHQDLMESAIIAGTLKRNSTCLIHNTMSNDVIKHLLTFMQQTVTVIPMVSLNSSQLKILASHLTQKTILCVGSTKAWTHLSGSQLLALCQSVRADMTVLLHVSTPDQMQRIAPLFQKGVIIIPPQYQGSLNPTLANTLKTMCHELDASTRLVFSPKLSNEQLICIASNLKKNQCFVLPKALSEAQLDLIASFLPVLKTENQISSDKPWTKSKFIAQYRQHHPSVDTPNNARQRPQITSDHTSITVPTTPSYRCERPSIPLDHTSVTVPTAPCSEREQPSIPSDHTTITVPTARSAKRQALPITSTDASYLNGLSSLHAAATRLLCESDEQQLSTSHANPSATSTAPIPTVRQAKTIRHRLITPHLYSSSLQAAPSAVSAESFAQPQPERQQPSPPNQNISTESEASTDSVAPGQKRARTHETNHLQEASESLSSNQSSLFFSDASYGHQDDDIPSMIAG